MIPTVVRSWTEAVQRIATGECITFPGDVAAELSRRGLPIRGATGVTTCLPPRTTPQEIARRIVYQLAAEEAVNAPRPAIEGVAPSVDDAAAVLPGITVAVAGPSVQGGDGYMVVIFPVTDTERGATDPYARPAYDPVLPDDFLLAPAVCPPYCGTCQGYDCTLDPATGEYVHAGTGTGVAGLGAWPVRRGLGANGTALPPPPPGLVPPPSIAAGYAPSGPARPAPRPPSGSPASGSPSLLGVLGPVAGAVTAVIPLSAGIYGAIANDMPLPSAGDVMLATGNVAAKLLGMFAPPIGSGVSAVMDTIEFVTDGDISAGNTIQYLANVAKAGASIAALGIPMLSASIQAVVDFTAIFTGQDGTEGANIGKMIGGLTGIALGLATGGIGGYAAPILRWLGGKIGAYFDEKAAAAFLAEFGAYDVDGLAAQRLGERDFASFQEQQEAAAAAMAVLQEEMMIVEAEAAIADQTVPLTDLNILGENVLPLTPEQVAAQQQALAEALAAVDQAIAEAIGSSGTPSEAEALAAVDQVLAEVTAGMDQATAEALVEDTIAAIEQEVPTLVDAEIPIASDVEPISPFDPTLIAEPPAEPEPMLTEPVPTEPAILLDPDTGAPVIDPATGDPIIVDAPITDTVPVEDVSGGDSGLITEPPMDTEPMPIMEPEPVPVEPYPGEYEPLPEPLPPDTLPPQEEYDPTPTSDEGGGDMATTPTIQDAGYTPVGITFTAENCWPGAQFDGPDAGFNCAAYIKNKKCAKGWCKAWRMQGGLNVAATEYSFTPI